MAGRARYDDIDFGIDVASNPRLPRPTIEEGTGVRRLTVAAVLDSIGAISAMEALLSTIRIKPAAGMVNGGVVSILAGPGSKTLIFPDADGHDLSCTAILTGMASSAALTSDAHYRADLNFTLTTEPA